MAVSRKSVASVAAVWVCSTGLFGCRVTLPHQEIPGGTNAELIEYIAEMPYVSADAAYRALHILRTNEVFEGDFDSLKAAMSDQGGVVAGIQPNECPDRQELCRAIVRACGISPGLNYRLTGLGRYALRDLQYQRIVRTQNDYGPFSGGEFLGILARAEEYMREHADVAGVDLGSEPGR